MKFFTSTVLIFFILTGFSPEKDHWKKNFPVKTEFPKEIPLTKNVWVFIMAGQSNMAGRGFIEPQDTLPSGRILTINSTGKLVLAKEPIHFYETDMSGLDCGISFAFKLLKHTPDSVSILLVPTAVGGSSVSQWLGDSLHRDVKLLSNFQEKTEIAKRYGQIKGILWHQGESDANQKSIPEYEDKLSSLFSRFRFIADNKSLPILTGEIGLFRVDNTMQKLINLKIQEYASKDPNTYLIRTGDFKNRGDQLHFNTKSQRLMGKRFAKMFIDLTR